MTTIGFGNVAGNTRAEKIFSIIIMFIGALMHATIFGNVASIISRMYSKRQEYDRKVLDLEHFIKVHKLPKHLKQRFVLKSLPYNFCWKHNIISTKLEID